MSDDFRIEISPAAALFYPLLLLPAEDWEILALLSAVAVHEAGHILALLGLGGRVYALSLCLGGLGLDAALPPALWAEVFCLLAGPCAGFLWAGIAAWLGGGKMLYASGLSALFSLFNLLPCLPLDGGRALLALTGRVKLLRRCGILCAVLLICAGLQRGLSLLLPPAAWLLFCQLSPRALR